MTMMNDMFENEAADAVHQVIMLGGETSYAVAYIQQAMQDAYNLGALAALAKKPPPVAPEAAVEPAPAVMVTPTIPTPAELMAEMAAFSKKGRAL